MVEIFVTKNYAQRGPFSVEEVYEHLRAGDFSWEDLAWREGWEGWQPLRMVMADLPPDKEFASQEPEPLFHHVAPWKFILLSIVTLGVYQLYWFYRGWRFVKNEERSNIMPFFRTLFAPIWFYPFAVRVFRHEGNPRKPYAAALAVAYFLIGGAWQFPNWLSLLSVGSFLFILPLVLSIDRSNRRDGVVGPAYQRFGWLHGLAVVFGVPVVGLFVATVLIQGPSTAVVDGTEVPESHLEFLRVENILPPGESIIAFYSAALFDYQADGNFFTEERVISYWKEAGEFWMEEVRWEGIEAITPDYSSSMFEDTILTVTRFDGSSFFLLLSNENGGDRRFVDRLMQQWESWKNNS